MYELLSTILVEEFQLERAAVQPHATRKEAGLDSLAVVELSMLLSKRYDIDISDDELLDLDTLADIARVMAERDPRP